MADPVVCPWCAEPLPAAGAERCPACGERPSSAPPPPTQAGAAPTGAPARRGQRGLLLACGLIALGMCVALGGVIVVADRPAWYGHPVAEPLFVASPTPRPAPAPAHVSVGQRWIFKDDWNQPGGRSRPAANEEHVWEVVEAGPAGVRYRYRGRTLDWAWAPLEAQDLFTSARTTLDVGGRTFDVAQVHVREWQSMMNDVQATVSVAMDGDRPTFPGVVKTVRSNQGFAQDGWTLVRIDPPVKR